jgi:branched-chain amino acid transport system substrate-binding protein
MNATGSALTRSSPYLVRTSVTTWQESYPLGKWMAEKGAKKAYVAVSDYAAGYDAEAAFVKGFTEGGGTIVGTVHFPLRNPDFAPYLQRIKDQATKPDVIFIFVPGVPQNSEIMKAASDVGLRSANIDIASTQDLVPDEELLTMGDPVLGVITAGVYSTAGDRPTNKAFLAAWRQVYGDALLPNYGSVSGWDGMAAIYHVVKETKGRFDSDQAMKLLRGWKTADSPRGSLEIDPATRDIVQNVYIRRVERVDGRLQSVEFATIPMVKDPWKEFNPEK